VVPGEGGVKLSRIFLDRPRAYPGGNLMGAVDASDSMRLEYEPGMLSVQRGDGPRVCFAIGPNDWWVPFVDAHVAAVDSPPQPVAVAAPSPTNSSRAQPQDEPWKRKNRR
jgi:hypothetical protein